MRYFCRHRHRFPAERRFEKSAVRRALDFSAANGFLNVARRCVSWGGYTFLQFCFAGRDVRFVILIKRPSCGGTFSDLRKRAADTEKHKKGET